jgi:glycosyltransferase involved in cell wall biosynthesis
VAPAGDVPALTDGILSLLQDAERRKHLGRAAQDFVRGYSADLSAAEFAKIYTRLGKG